MNQDATCLRLIIAANSRIIARAKLNPFNLCDRDYSKVEEHSMARTRILWGNHGWQDIGPFLGVGTYNYTSRSTLEVRSS